jgi:hypothetical protein
VSGARASEELLEPLRRALGWIASLCDSRGRIVCPEHRIEHTGKSAGAAVLASVLARRDRPELRARHLALALGQGRRLVANLAREGASECHTFRPGRHDPFNNSNAIIDGGACSDALVELATAHASDLPADDRAAFVRAAELHARTYLRYAVLDKGVPAQRAWGLTGLAAAWSTSRDAELEQAALAALDALAQIQRRDGSFPYHPREWGGEHPGASDASCFYHSRIPGFSLFALERLGREAARSPYERSLRTALDFAEALQGPDGIKCGLVEAKPWYWGAHYEVASHPFDVYAFSRAAAIFGEARFARAALRAFRAWADHLAPSGEPRSHLPAPRRRKSYQCSVFWACHAQWIARALDDLERCSAHPAEAAAPCEPTLRFFADASLARLEDAEIVAWVRGARPEYNVHHGSPHGAGLLRVVRKQGLAELVRRERHALDQEAEWSARCGSIELGRGFAGNGRELRFSLWLARNHLRGRRVGSAIAAPFDVLLRGPLAFASPGVSSAFALDPVVEAEGTRVRMRSALAWRGGKRVERAALARSFAVGGRGLEVEERALEPGPARGLRYRVPAAALEVERRGEREISYRLA